MEYELLKTSTSDASSGFLTFTFLEKLVLFSPSHITKGRNRWLNTTAIIFSITYLSWHLYNSVYIGFHISLYLGFTSRIFIIVLEIAPHILSYARLHFFVREFDLSMLHKIANYKHETIKTMKKHIRLIMAAMLTYLCIICITNAVIVSQFSQYVSYYSYVHAPIHEYMPCFVTFAGVHVYNIIT